MIGTFFQCANDSGLIMPHFPSLWIHTSIAQVISNSHCLSLSIFSSMDANSRISDQLSFFWEVYKIKEVPDLLDLDDLSSLEHTVEKITELVQAAGERPDPNTHLLSFPLALFRSNFVANKTDKLLLSSRL